MNAIETVSQVVPAADQPNPLLTEVDVMLAAGVATSQVQGDGQFAQRLLASALTKIRYLTRFVVQPSAVVERYSRWDARLPLANSALMDGRLPDAANVTNIVVSYIDGDNATVTAPSGDYGVDQSGDVVALWPGDDLLGKALSMKVSYPVSISYDFDPGTLLNRSLLGSVARLLIRAEMDSEQGIEGDTSGAMAAALRMLTNYNRCPVAA